MSEKGERTGSADDEAGRPAADTEAGPSGASLGLSPEHYRQLKQIARQRLSGHRPGATLDCTALVHEAYLKINSGRVPSPGDTNHLMAVASLAMRQILVDAARRKRADKRGGGALHVTFQESQVGESGPVIDLIELDDALGRLAQRDPSLERLVVLRFFAGLSMEQTAQVLGKSLRTTERDWTRARVYLYRELEPDGD